MLALVALLASFDLAAQDVAWEGRITAGQTALRQQKFSEAEEHFVAALEEAERFPEGDPRLGKSLNNLAAVYYAQEDYARAEPLMRRALGLLQDALGPSDLDVAQTMKNLAALYFLQNNFDDAEPLLKNSLAIFEERLGPNHAYVATVLSNLATVYQSQNRLEEAEPILVRSLQIWESLLGDDHPDVARSRALLERVREVTGGREPARPQVAAAPPAGRPAAVEETGLLPRASAATRPDVAPLRLPDSISPAPSRLGASSPAARPVAAAVIKPVKPGQTPGPSVGAPSFALYLSTLWSKNAAERYWQEVREDVPEVLRGKQLELEEVAMGGGRGAFYRVLTGPFASDPDADAACRQIESQVTLVDCDVVVR